MITIVQVQSLAGKLAPFYPLARVYGIYWLAGIFMGGIAGCFPVQGRLYVCMFRSLRRQGSRGNSAIVKRTISGPGARTTIPHSGLDPLAGRDRDLGRSFVTRSAVGYSHGFSCLERRADRLRKRCRRETGTTGQQEADDLEESDLVTSEGAGDAPIACYFVQALTNSSRASVHPCRGFQIASAHPIENLYMGCCFTLLYTEFIAILTILPSYRYNLPRPNAKDSYS
jgi:hypothetical protein